MSKKQYYSVKYADNTGRIFTNFEQYKRGTKGYSGSSSRGFKTLKAAIKWLDGIPYKINESDATLITEDTKVTEETVKTEDSKGTKYFAVARGRHVGIIKDKKIFNDSITGYKKAIYNSSCNTKKQAERWLRKKGITPNNEKGVYAVYKGHKSGVFTNLHTYEKNMIDYPGAIGKAGFENKQQARKWLDDAKKNQKKYHVIVVGKRKGIYTDKKKFDNNLDGIKNSWRKDGFKSREDAQKWFDERTAFISKYKNNLYKEVIIAYESKRLPVIYIDGSYFHRRKQYSSSVVICEKDGSISTFAKLGMGNKNNIDGEIEALLFALKLVVGLYDFREFILVYDFDNLEKVARNQMKIKGISHKVQDQIFKIIKTSELDIHFLNVKAHTGIIGNTVADKIARDIIENSYRMDPVITFEFDQN